MTKIDFEDNVWDIEDQWFNDLDKFNHYPYVYSSISASLQQEIESPLDREIELIINQ